ncbi:hypothetical protein B0T22DRAFT_480064 [Podospora appendiculata]|uniref:GMC oxidoreductase n=1 Tax=Podospora appendiculata TaxID=314037 RepID=A0AAE0XA60_9PEZI|nr:hypothetical protein B0T22DRAFT_480064 [Podospora appendiculata]
MDSQRGRVWNPRAFHLKVHPPVLAGVTGGILRHTAFTFPHHSITVSPTLEHSKTQSVALEQVLGPVGSWWYQNLTSSKFLTYTIAHKVLFYPLNSDTATGILLTNSCTITAQNKVILCAGTYRTPQLLFLFGIVPPRDPRKAQHPSHRSRSTPAVGQNLHNHFTVNFAFRLRDPAQGHSLGSAHTAWTFNPAMFKYILWDWVVSELLPPNPPASMRHAQDGRDGSVVDGEDKLGGMKGLRVVDASIVPIPLEGHPQATLDAVAEQIAGGGGGRVIERM